MHGDFAQKEEWDISYRDQFNEHAGFTAQEMARELETANVAQAAELLAGAIEADGSGYGGRIATNATLTAEAQHIAQEKREKDDATLIQALRLLEETLRQIDERIAQLDQKIAVLQLQIDEATERSEEAFGRMHELEELVDEINRDGLSASRKEQLTRIIGSVAEDDDEALLVLADQRIDEEHRVGIEATVEAENLRDEMERKIAVRDELIEARDNIMDDTDASPEERAARAQAALDRSMESDIDGTQSVRGIFRGNSIASLEDEFNEQRTALSENDEFEMDEDMVLEEFSPTLPGPR